MKRPQQMTLLIIKPGRDYALIRPVGGSELTPERCKVLQYQPEQDGKPANVYVHFPGKDSRLDEWVEASSIAREWPHPTVQKEGSENGATDGGNEDASEGGDAYAGDMGTDLAGSRKRKSLFNDSSRKYRSHPDDVEAQYETAVRLRNFSAVRFGEALMDTWYFSPYPQTDILSAPAIQTTSKYNLNYHPPGHAPKSRNGSLTNEDDALKLTKHAAPKGGRAQDVLTGEANKLVESVNSILYICEQCFAYTTSGASLLLHEAKCDTKNPPGRKVYQKGAHTIWEVDGESAKLYCQNLSLFGKLFINQKTLFYNVDQFMFYVMSATVGAQTHVVGFFSKEKRSLDDCNLACIIVFPSAQKSGYGRLLIEFSYELTRNSSSPGTPERPLSDLGFKGYLSYWTATLIRLCLVLLDPEAQKQEQARVDEEEKAGARRKHIGYEGEVRGVGKERVISEGVVCDRQMLVVGGVPQLHLIITIQELARAAHIKLEDVLFTLGHCGLIDYYSPSAAAAAVGRNSSTDSEEQYAYITEERVKQIYTDRKIKLPILRSAYVLL